MLNISSREYRESYAPRTTDATTGASPVADILGASHYQIVKENATYRIFLTMES